MKLLVLFAVSLGIVASLGTAYAAEPAVDAPHAAPSASSSGDAAKGAALRDQGNQAMLEMRYVDALASYREALAVEPSNVGVLYSIARAHQLMGEFPEALRYLEQFAVRASPETKARVGRLDELFAELRARVGTLQLTCNVAGARVSRIFQ